MNTPERWMETNDQAHEKRLIDTYCEFLAGRADWDDVVRVHAQRSPDVVKAMEKQKGLR